MNRTELIVATAVVLFVAFVLGWFVCWIMHRFARVAQSDLGELDRMAQHVHEAEEERDAAKAELHAREKDLSNRLAQSEAELRAAMEGLRVARRDAEELRERLEEGG